MKRFIALFCVLVLALVLAAGCGGQQQQPQQQPSQQQNEQAQQPSQEEATALKDGVYTAEEPEFDDHGWKAITTVVVKDGKIANVFYDEINKDNQIKSLDQDYASNMKEKSGETPLDAVAKLSASLLEKQDPANVDTVTGATSTTNKFKTLVAEALKSSPEEKGAGGYYDGIFKAEEKDFDEHGYKAYATVIIKDGKVANAYYDELSKDTGTFKSKDENYQKNMKAKTGVSNTEAIPQLIQSLITKQDAEQVDAVTGATGTTQKFKTLMGEALSLAK
ncbi:FMN-binding protein [Calorimonas adulescens]|uniref:FMN-binding protein n=1 Tax=Calorimonas adulescens TaxID=2606906 RepID=A0A5D8QE63_9THEO|nr:FMN-binding protein [Calorimonas adulescens]TZE82801.1 FMN-binding protein [Calorimonas adulescens]